MRLLFLLALACVAGAGCSSTTATTPAADQPSTGLTITTDKGAVSGKMQGQTRAFLGIPFAAPPIGPLRWKSPQPAAAWTTTRDATVAGAVCPQIPLLSTTFDDASSEDCLTLNVFAPATASHKPVMVWVHGGSYTSGSGGSSLYDGQKLSEAGDVVIVTINYRLGALGFLGHAQLTGEDPAYQASGSYGLEDQRAALRWVAANITAFGGDPANVTLFGESAGAGSVLTHLVSPPSKGLFHRALSQSGYFNLFPTQAEADAQGARLATALGCTDAAKALTCLRAKTPKEIVLALPERTETNAAVKGADWSPVVDTINLTAQPFSLMHDGQMARVPVLLGANADEGTLFVRTATIASDTDYKNALTGLVGETVAAKVITQYPSSAFKDAHSALAAALGDSVFVCPTRRVARYSAAVGNPTFLYRFKHAIDLPLLPGLGSFHSSEIPFIFGNPLATFNVSEAETPLSTSMMSYWTHFAIGGDPNGGTTLAWPAYLAASDQNLTLDLTNSVETKLTSPKCDFWDGIDPY